MSHKLDFHTKHIPAIKSRDKESTIRLNTGYINGVDNLELVNEEGDTFAYAQRTGAKIMLLGNLVDKNWENHRNYNSLPEVFKEFRKYYPHKVLESETIVCKIDFEVTELVNNE